MKRSRQAEGTDVGQRIRTMRRARNLTQEQLAEAADVTVESLSRAERGTILPSVLTLAKLARALRTSMDVLAGNEAPVTPPDGRRDYPELTRLKRQLDELDRGTVAHLLAIVDRLPRR
jgi:transcriptional regulator with XRE-family HTH domain